MSLEKQLADYGQLQEELFGPISADEVNSPIGPPLTTDVGNRPPQTRLGRGIGWAVAAFAVVLTVGGMYFAFSGEDGQAVDQTTVPTPTTVTTSVSGSMWPQSSLEEVEEAQELADAGDPEHTWQVDPQLSSEEWWGYLRNSDAEIVERFLQEELGWDHALFDVLHGDDGDGAADGVIRGVVFLRCAADATNAMYPLPPAEHQEAPSAERCAPTIDDLHYESVSLDLSQLDRRGSDGLWVVSRWAMTAPFAQTDPSIAEAEATARLEDFMAARVAGDGAEGYVDVAGDSHVSGEFPLLYATTSGAPYERYEIELMSGPWWPYGEMEFMVRLFANGGETVVEQPIAWRDVGGARVTLAHDAKETTENGQAVPVLYSYLDGEVTMDAAHPWRDTWLNYQGLMIDEGASHDLLYLMGDPWPVETGCTPAPPPADADALAAHIQADPDFEATAPVALIVGGIEALRMDVRAAAGASVCAEAGAPIVLNPDGSEAYRGLALGEGSRIRLYLVDLPEGSSMRVLAIAIVASEARFERAAELAAPVVDSIEFPLR
jgi:hypothetical protein